MTEEKPTQEEATTEAKAAPEEKPAAPASPPKKKKKINKMTLEEIEERLKYVQETQGGLDSLYARHLLQRKEYLLQQKKTTKKSK